MTALLIGSRFVCPDHRESKKLFHSARFGTGAPETKLVRPRTGLRQTCQDDVAGDHRDEKAAQRDETDRIHVTFDEPQTCLLTVSPSETPGVRSAAYLPNAHFARRVETDRLLRSTCGELRTPNVMIAEAVVVAMTAPTRPFRRAASEPNASREFRPRKIGEIGQLAGHDLALLTFLGRERRMRTSTYSAHDGGRRDWRGRRAADRRRSCR